MRRMNRELKKSKCSNPLFEQWLEEWQAEAVTKNQQLQYCFGKALASLRKYPLPLASGKDCIILQHFGSKLCSMLDRKLLEYQKTPSQPDLLRRTNSSESIDHTIMSKKCRKDSSKQNVKEKILKPTKSPESTNYVPQRGTGAYALLLTLYKKTKDPQYIGYMNKADLQADARHLCDKSFTKPDPGCYHTAWSSMSTLIDKGFVLKCSSPAKYSLTDKGVAMAIHLYDFHENNAATTSTQCSTSNFELAAQSIQQSIHSLSPDSLINVESTDHEMNDVIHLDSRYNKKHSQVTENEKISPTSHDIEHLMHGYNQDSGFNSITESSSATGSYSENTIIFRSGTFDVILLVDTQETAGSKTRPKDDVTIAELSKSKILFEVRHLKVGDFTWIARCKHTNNELVLPYIVERKRMDDFGGSIKDGRFHEQKFRLKQSGIQNLIYLVESHGNNQHTGLPLTTLYQAATNTLIQDGFTLKFTNSHRDSMFYLATMTVMLSKMYQQKTLMSCHKEDLKRPNNSSDIIRLMIFNDFNKAASKVKNFKVKQMLIRQLLQLRGISVEKALAIVKLYPTPKALHQAFCNVDNNGEKLLSQVTYGTTKRQLGPVLSKTLHQFYTRRDY